VNLAIVVFDAIDECWLWIYGASRCRIVSCRCFHGTSYRLLLGWPGAWVRNAGHERDSSIRNEVQCHMSAHASVKLELIDAVSRALEVRRAGTGIQI
jgi:hypothetical protein